MIFLYLLELVIALLFVLGVVTQLAVPLVMNRPLFPLLRGWNRARVDLSEATEDVEVAKVEREIKARRDSANKIRRADELR